jgi:hypothetical protein
MLLISKSAVAFFFLFFLHGTSIGNGQQGISANVEVFVSGGHKYTLKLTASCPPACTNTVLAAVYYE